MPGAHPQRRKQSYLLDPRFQLKWTGYLVAVVLAVMASLGWIIARTASDSARSAGIAVELAEKAVEQAKKAAEESRTNSILARQSVMLAAPEMATVMNESLEELDKKEAANVAEIQKRAKEIHQSAEEVKKGQRELERLLAGAGIALLVLLVGMGVVITHRIVGPVHKMKRLLRRVSTGRLVIEDRLRKGDELEDLFDTFLQMTYSLRAMQRARLATLDSTLKHAESGNTPKEVIEGLRALRAQMVLGLERRRPSQYPASER
jgi:nitrogen fixation/metabolism regulation signal transduction histidine kinase